MGAAQYAQGSAVSWFSAQGSEHVGQAQRAESAGGSIPPGKYPPSSSVCAERSHCSVAAPLLNRGGRLVSVASASRSDKGDDT